MLLIIGILLLALSAVIFFAGGALSLVMPVVFGRFVETSFWVCLILGVGCSFFWLVNLIIKFIG